MYVRKYIFYGEYLFLFRTRYLFKGAGAEFLWIKSFLAGSSLDASEWVNIYAPEFKQIPCIFEKVKYCILPLYVISYQRLMFHTTNE